MTGTAWISVSGRENPKEVFASDLGFAMIGSIISQKKNNVALLKIKASGKVLACRAGYPLMDKYTVVEIRSDYLILKESSVKQEAIFKVYKDGLARIPSASQSTAQTTTNQGMTGSFREEGFEREKNTIRLSEDYRSSKIIAELPKILMQASAEPVISNGIVRGFILDQIDEDSIFAKSGLTNGDIIRSINDIPLDNIAATIKLLNSLKNEKEINFVLERSGQTIPIRVNVD